MREGEGPVCEHEAAGILRRSVGTDGPVRVEYELTRAGQALVDVIASLGAWAERYARKPIPSDA